MNEQVTFISSQSQWDRVAAELAAEPLLALDLESNGYHRYPDRICLIQIGLPRAVYLVDPLSVGNLEALAALLVRPDCQKIFHASENDLRSLHRDYGFPVINLFDTALAAHFSGHNRLGLATVLKEILDVELPKSKSLQRQDWTLRPLPETSLQYAANDVSHLFKLRERLLERLNEMGRAEWVSEENQRLEQIRSSPAVPAAELFWAVKGSHTLNDKQRPVLKEAVIFRDRLCRKIDRVPFRVISDETLLILASQPASTPLEKTKGLSLIRQIGKLPLLAAALQKGRQSAGVPMRKTGGKPAPKKQPDYFSNLAVLKAWRLSEGKRLSLDPALVWPLPSLERMARSLSPDVDGPEVRRWQAREFSPALEHVLKQLKQKKR